MDYEFQCTMECIKMLSSFVSFVEHRYPDVLEDFFREYSEFDYLMELLKNIKGYC